MRINFIKLLKRTTLLTILLCFPISIYASQTQIGYASWYARHGDNYDPFPHTTMANGKELNDEAFTCASWNYPFDTRLSVRNLTNGKKVIVIVSDRGPAKRLARQGRIIDLSKAAFAAIADLKTGVIKVKIERL